MLIGLRNSKSAQVDYFLKKPWCLALKKKDLINCRKMLHEFPLKRSVQGKMNMIHYPQPPVPGGTP
jgi:hypothetical protein